MPVIIESTKGIPVQLLFNNAGFITTGFFAETDINRLTVTIGATLRQI
jgi:short-subunit dehydrogenase